MATNSKVPWYLDDLKFKQRLERGYQWQEWLGRFFELHGIQVKIPELKFRDSIEQAINWREGPADLILNGKYYVEVKARTFKFYGPDNFQFPDIIVDVVKKYDAKNPRPLAYIIISEPTGGMIAIWGTKTKALKIKKIHDYDRSIDVEVYTAPKESFRSIDVFVDWIKQLDQQNA